ncbi:phosphopantothenate/pantothenate synthetase [Candidatus Methanomassiliicoccus intestinalis]|uniref:phosphopantothenate/pantothenate synthetase n=1 Tax=Candidatus Methanomassiliicoccus intestinalis TaxID=1406512 RepID=UPI0037DD0B58
MDVSPDHPRYKSLVIREKMSELSDKGIVARTGLIAHGRGEAFDYLIGEKTTPAAKHAEEAIAAYLLEAQNPVITINGNAAALCAEELLNLASEVGAKVEVNIFHWSSERLEKLVSYLETFGNFEILGRNQNAILENIASDRARCCREGIYSADVVLIPLEDGDRAKALKIVGKTVLAIDLNPLSRTSVESDATAVDEITRAVPNIRQAVKDLKDDQKRRREIISAFDNRSNLNESVNCIKDNLTQQQIF